MSDTIASTVQIEIVRRYLTALQAGATGETLAAFFTPDAIQEEFPNRLNPNGATSDLATLLVRSERGREVLSGQTYEMINAISSGNTVALELNWTGTLAVGVGPLEAGEVMRARFAIFIELRDGKIFRQRNYDCFEPW